METLKILLVGRTFNVRKYKGIARHNLEVYTHMKKTDHEVDIVLRKEQFPERLYFLGKFRRKMNEAAKKYDIIHFLSSNEVPLFKQYLNIVTFHDLCPITMAKELYKFPYVFMVPIYKYVYYWKVIRESTRLIAISTQTKKELSTFYNTDSVVINNGVNEKFKPLNMERKFDVLFFHSDMIRKRPYYVNYLPKDFRILVAGGAAGRPWLHKKYSIKKRNNMKILGSVPDEKVPELYNSAKVFFFPSKWEGFGLPILESARCMTPPITMADAKIPDEVKSCSIVAEDINDAINIIRELVNDENYRQKVARKLYKKSLEFSWDKNINETIRLYKEVLSQE